MPAITPNPRPSLFATANIAEALARRIPPFSRVGDRIAMLMRTPADPMFLKPTPDCPWSRILALCAAVPMDSAPQGWNLGLGLCEDTHAR